MLEGSEKKQYYGNSKTKSMHYKNRERLKALISMRTVAHTQSNIILGKQT